MKERIAVVYDMSAREAKTVERLMSRLSLGPDDVMAASAFDTSRLPRYDVLLLVSAHWADAVLPGEWLRLAERIGVHNLSGRTVVPVSLSRPLSVSAAPALRRMLLRASVRIISAVEVAFVPEGHCFSQVRTDNGRHARSHKDMESWVEVFYSDSVWES